VTRGDGSSDGFHHDDPAPASSSIISKEGNAMNAEQLRGKWMQFKGELKEKWGKFTDNDLQEIGGNYDRFVRKAQERYGEKKRELMKWADQWYHKAPPDKTGKKIQ
jgi:uncharacterized protein YjbJ (UPF0337 family)